MFDERTSLVRKSASTRLKKDRRHGMCFNCESQSSSSSSNSAEKSEQNHFSLYEKVSNNCSNPVNMDVRGVVPRPSHLKIPGGPKMARAALKRRAIDGPCVVM